MEDLINLVRGVKCFFNPSIPGNRKKNPSQALRVALKQAQMLATSYRTTRKRALASRKRALVARKKDLLVRKNAVRPLDQRRMGKSCQMVRAQKVILMTKPMPHKLYDCQKSMTRTPRTNGRIAATTLHTPWTCSLAHGRMSRSGKDTPSRRIEIR